MDSTRFGRLVDLMAAMAEGDELAVLDLFAEFSGPIASAVRRHLMALGIDRPEADDLAGLVLDACFVLAGCAGGWKPARGALPWTWADRRLRQLASSFIGQHADALDPADEFVAHHPAYGATRPGPCREPDDAELFARLAKERPDVALLAEALERVTTPRNRTILLAFKVQASMGDPSPAHTVGRDFHMKPDAIRQVVKRTLDRLRQLADQEPRYQPLGGIALLAA